MRIRQFMKTAMALGAVGGLALSVPSSASDQSDRDRARAAVAGVAIAVAIAKAKKDRDRERAYDRYERDGRYYYRGRDWGREFRPAGTENTICYTRVRQCYTKGQYSLKWTRREFGY